MARRLNRTPDYISRYDPKPPVTVGNVPWADYYKSLFPGHVHPRNGWEAWKFRTTAGNISQTLWEARERSTVEWQSRSAKPPITAITHPPVVLWLPYVAPWRFSSLYVDRRREWVDRRGGCFRKVPQRCAWSRSSSGGSSQSSDFRT